MKQRRDKRVGQWYYVVKPRDRLQIAGRVRRRWRLVQME